jgi:hypothetical protein
MKEFKPKITDINAKRNRAETCRQTSQHHCMPVSGREPIQGATTAIAALQPQMKQEDVLQGKTGWQGLTAQAARINQLAAELEEAMFEFKVIANDVNLERRITQATKKPIKSVCEYLTAIVPCVKHKKGGAFVLTTRKVDLFQAEREALQVAQVLRRQAKRRRVASPPSRNKLPVLGWLI